MRMSQKRNERRWQELNYNFIRGQIAEKRTSQRKVAAEMGISEQSLNRKLSGKRAFTVEEAKKICDILDIPPHRRAEIFLPCSSQKRNV